MMCWSDDNRGSENYWASVWNKTHYIPICLLVNLRLITINERNKHLCPQAVRLGRYVSKHVFFYWPLFDEWCAIWCWKTLRGWIDQIGHVMALFNISRMFNIPHPIWYIKHDKTNLWWLEMSKAKGRIIREKFFYRYCISFHHLSEDVSFLHGKLPWIRVGDARLAL